MNLFEDQTAAFMLRIWVERRELAGAPVEWRGLIEHVTSGQRHYTKDLTTMLHFVKQYMVELGVDFRPENDPKP